MTFVMTKLERMAESVNFFRVHASCMWLDWRARPSFGVHNVVLPLNGACTRLACAIIGVQSSIDRKNTSVRVDQER